MTRAIAAAAPKIDIHVHLAGVGTQGSGCWTSPAFLRRPTFLGLRFLYRIDARQMTRSVDQDWAAMISRRIEESELDMAVALGFDGVYDGRGEMDRQRSQLVIPVSWVLEVCGRYANLLPGPSINPYRRDALEQLELAIAGHAVLIKWLPIVQGFDPASRRARPFLRRMAEAGLPLLVHAGSGEVTFRTVDPGVGDLSHLIPALEEGVTVICAHAAARIHHRTEPCQQSRLRALMRRFPNLWVDNSGLTNLSRFLHLARFASDPELAGRVLHGSDFPIPPVSMLFTGHLGPRGALRTAKVRNPFQREIEIKRALGYADDILRRAAAVLPHLDRWWSPPAPGTAPPTG